MTAFVKSQLKAITPFDLYIQRVSNIYEQIRVESNGMTFIGSQFGGLLGQRETLQEDAVLEILTFDVPNDG